MQQWRGHQIGNSLLSAVDWKVHFISCRCSTVSLTGAWFCAHLVIDKVQVHYNEISRQISLHISLKVWFVPLGFSSYFEREKKKKDEIRTVCLRHATLRLGTSAQLSWASFPVTTSGGRMRLSYGTTVVTAGIAGIVSFGLLAAAIGSEYWYIIEVNRPNETDSKDLNSHSGLWRIYEGKLKDTDADL